MLVSTTTDYPDKNLSKSVFFSLFLHYTSIYLFSFVRPHLLVLSDDLSGFHLTQNFLI